MKNGKYWFDTGINKIMDINDNCYLENGEPAPPMGCILIEVNVLDDYSEDPSK